MLFRKLFAKDDDLENDKLEPLLEYIVDEQKTKTTKSSTAVVTATVTEPEAAEQVSPASVKSSATLTETKLKGLRVVCISDTHGCHRSLEMPPGDILIHGGDYTRFGNKEDALDFNLWLGEQNYRHVFVVQGNHESNAEWNKEAKEILSNAHLLVNESFYLEEFKIHIFGSQFYWTCLDSNPYYSLMPEETDILIAHNPPKGSGVDGDNGCPSLMNRIKEVKPKLVVSGHLHFASRAIEHGKSDDLIGTLFVNAANAGRKGHAIKKQPLVLYY